MLIYKGSLVKIKNDLYENHVGLLHDSHRRLSGFDVYFDPVADLDSGGNADL